MAKLVEIGVVQVQEASGRGLRRKEFVVNPQRVYQVTEEFRKVSMATVGGPVPRDATVGLPTSSATKMEPGPKLVLVHGFLEGKAFPLRRADLGDGKSWIIGRKQGLNVSLDYDPYVSLVNSEVVLDAGEYLLGDLGSSKNGTLLNWQPLGEQHARLTSGDVIGVGRSLLVFRRE